MRSVVNWSTVIFHQRNTMKSVTLDDTKEYFREKKELLDNKRQMLDNLSREISHLEKELGEIQNTITTLSKMQYWDNSTQDNT